MADKTIQDRVDERTTRTFSVTNCPEVVWRDFKTYADKETNSNYSMAIKLLLSSNKANAKERLLYERYIHLDSRLKKVENELKLISEFISKVQTEEVEEEIEEEVPKKVTVPTMGSGKDMTYKDKKGDD